MAAVSRWLVSDASRTKISVNFNGVTEDPSMAETPRQFVRGALNRLRPLLDFLCCHVIDKLAQEKISPCGQKCADQHNRNDTDQNPRHDEAVPDPPQNLSQQFWSGPKHKDNGDDDEQEADQSRTEEFSPPRGADQRKCQS